MVQQSLLIGAGIILLSLIGLLLMLRRFRRLRAQRQRANKKIAELEAEIADLPETEDKNDE